MTLLSEISATDPETVTRLRIQMDAISRPLGWIVEPGCGVGVWG
jgi:hypothetical protein